MNAFQPTHTATLSLLVALAALTAGCREQAGEPSGNAAPATATAKDDPSHSGWWCVEHGIPEAECSMCSAKVAEKFKEQGDWCEEHNRAKSQCFICDPEKAEKFAKLYEAKFGQAPPAPQTE